MLPSSLQNRIFPLPPNRVWRTYQGGRQLDALAQHDDNAAAAPADGHFPEDWIASLTNARNSGREHLADEGLSLVGDAENTATALPLKNLIAADPEYFLGAAHIARFGADPRLLVKFLDPAIRLHLQVHPTADFARRFLDSPSGKTEAYHVLGIRPGCDGRIWLGFRNPPPTRAELRRMIETQDIAAMKTRLNTIDAHPGDTFIVPGGTPHALGAGLFVVEAQEPSDLVVRFEFRRGDLVLPEPARFMGRGLDFCLDIFDLAPHDEADADAGNGNGAARFRCQPRRLREWNGGASWRDELIGPDRTPCFRMTRLHLADGAPVTLDDTEWTIAIVTAGACEVRTAGDPGAARPPPPPAPPPPPPPPPRAHTT
ncbi:MAG: phosphoheptose isomerase, partial [Opitutaceae bacterium]|nr:phosphoheptose isomerase [Opitutaceae bacterium]